MESEAGYVFRWVFRLQMKPSLIYERGNYELHAQRYIKRKKSSIACEAC